MLVNVLVDHTVVVAQMAIAVLMGVTTTCRRGRLIVGVEVVVEVGLDLCRLHCCCCLIESGGKR